jgi:alpha-ketoglutarate-dependent taurine dioxygenase
MDSGGSYSDSRAVRVHSYEIGADPTPIVEHLESFNFAVVDLSGAVGAVEQQMGQLADALSLGAPVIPVLYRSEEGKRYRTEFTPVQNDTQDAHPGFGASGGLDWHVDGLLDEIGEIRTTLLYCVSPAAEGGKTLLFNAGAAFALLHETDTEAAEALMSPLVLSRYATLRGTSGTYRGPAFIYEADGRIATRFTDNHHCIWHEDAHVDGSVKRALAFMREASADPEYSVGVHLEAGQVLVFCNDRISHGRTPYVDKPDRQRLLVRALYGLSPSRGVDTMRILHVKK